MQEYVIGVDIGTGSTKAVALNTDRKVIATSQSWYNTSSPKPGYSELDPEAIWLAFTKCINEVVGEIKDIPLAVSISSAMHSVMVVNDKSMAITSLITWEDSRSDAIAEALRNTEEGETLYRSTGTPIHSMSPLCKIKWLHENDSMVFQKAFKFISIKEFIWFRLFHEYEIDHSIASATGLFNIENLQWNEPSLKFCGINASGLSTPVPTNFTRNNMIPGIATTLAIPEATSFCIGASDGCLANLGSEAIVPGVAALTIGTSGAIRIANPKPLPDYKSMIFNYVLDKETFICGGPVNNGGNVLKWMFATFLNNAHPSELDYTNIFKRIEAIPAGSQGLIFLPYLYGERAPIWDERASGVFFGIQSFHSSAHFFRAALEGICFALKNILEIMEASTTPIQQLNVSGGFVHSVTWMQLLADICGKPLCLVQADDASSIGAALLGMKSLHIIREYVSPEANTDRFIRPRPEAVNAYMKYYPVFKELYPLLKISMHQLHGIKT